MVQIVFHNSNITFSFLIFVGKNSRGIRVSSYDPDDPASQSVATGKIVAPKTLGNQRKFTPGQRVATISQNYNEKTMLLSSDDEYQ